MSRALVLGDDTRAFLAAVRSLGRQGIEVDVIPTNWASPALRSRYIRKVFRLSDMNLDPAAWRADLVSLAAEANYDFILPCTDNMVVALQMCRDKLPVHCLAMVGESAFDILFDKINTRELAAECAVPVASGRRLQSNDDAGSLIAKLGLPMAIKARSSVFERALGRRHAVAICRTHAQVELALARIEQPEDFLAEALFKGRGVGLSVLAHQGRVLQAFQHIRVNESLSGKGSYYRKSVQIDPALLTHVEAIAARTCLTGLAMFEFCRNLDTGQTILLEVNARPWGSMPLAIASGVDFPFLYFKLVVEGVEELRRDAAIGVYGRNVTGDANSLIDALTSSSIGVSKRAVASNVFRRLVGLWRLPLGLDRTDVAAKDDPEPGKADWDEYWRLWRERLEPRLALLGLLFRRSERRRLALLLAGKAEIGKILVLCRGNICRSPYAEVKLAQLLRERGSSMVEVSSAGTMPQPGRPTPDAGIEAARRLGVDLSAHRSTYIANVDLADYDFILHFDPLIDAELRQLLGVNTPPVFNLAYLVPEPSPRVQIKDPIGQSADRFFKTYQVIDASLKEMLDLMDRHAH